LGKPDGSDCGDVEAMLSEKSAADAPVVLVTGAAKRVGAAIVKRLHREGWRVAIHYRASADAAHALAATLNATRPDSAMTLQADLLETTALDALVQQVIAQFGRLDALVNNASTFYPTTLLEFTESDWRTLIGSNLKVPLGLSQAAARHLIATRGCIVNITDIHAERPMPGYLLYNVAKSGLRGLTLALARDLAPQVRVNAVAPGPIEWPDDGQIAPEERARILDQVPLKREGGAEQIAEAVKYLVCDATFVTGQTINVDGGRSIAL
jgi:pteridine reductase